MHEIELGQAVYYAATSLAQDLPGLVGALLASIGLSVAVVLLEPSHLVAEVLLAAVFAAVLVLSSRRYLERASTTAWAARTQVLERMADALQGRLELVASGQRSAFLENMRALTSRWLRGEMSLGTVSAIAGRTPLLALGLAVGFVAATRRGALGTADGMFGEIVVLASIAPAFGTVAQGIHSLLRANRWLSVVAGILCEEERPKARHSPLPSLPADVVFDRVSFQYESHGDRVEALRDVTFTWRSGTRLTLAGANGSGKSTCLYLVLGLAEPTAGTVTIGGVPLSSVRLDEWRSLIAFVPQKPYLPARATVRGAIRFLAGNADDAVLLRALEDVGLPSTLRRPGIEILDVRIDTLSSGQRQRVAIARALCSQRPVLLLDEPDANLDPEAVEQLAELIRSLSRRRMVAYCAHTKELASAADYNVVLGEGMVLRSEERAMVPPRSR